MKKSLFCDLVYLDWTRSNWKDSQGLPGRAPSNGEVKEERAFGSMSDMKKLWRSPASERGYFVAIMGPVEDTCIPHLEVLRGAVIASHQGPQRCSREGCRRAASTRRQGRLQDPVHEWRRDLCPAACRLVNSIERCRGVASAA
ncbi:hypothetical protein HPP92_008807 [Vanilla planifolia]|uniref:Uncharacterized protein n=1 Tax=Vanilla planifolia TaxID=51239 RepID=A0A835RE13_VANPL|nr:hypothetical protein HPP92_008807 [Vanilla planifolia]